MPTLFGKRMHTDKPRPVLNNQMKVLLESFQIAAILIPPYLANTLQAKRFPVLIAEIQRAVIRMM